MSFFIHPFSFLRLLLVGCALMPLTFIFAQEEGVPSVGQEVPAVQSTNNEALSTEPAMMTSESSEEGEVSVPATDPSLLPPSEASGDTNEVSVTPVPSDPNLSTPSLSEPEEPAPLMYSTESIEKKNQQLKVRYYEVRTQVEKDPAVVALQERVTKATRDEEKRQALRSYYDLLFAKMKQVDASIVSRCDTMQAAYLRHLQQVSIEPSVPLEPTASTVEPPKVVISPALTPENTIPSAAKKEIKKKRAIKGKVVPSNH